MVTCPGTDDQGVLLLPLSYETAQGSVPVDTSHGGHEGDGGRDTCRQ
jgi:hypothetical protein